MTAKIELTPNAKKIVADLLATGLFGATEVDVVERLFYEKLREMVAKPPRERPPWSEPQIR